MSIRTAGPTPGDPRTTPDSEPAADEQAPPDLAENEVRLSDGRIIAVRNISTLDMDRNLEILRQAGLSTSQIGPERSGLYATILAIDAINGQPIARPRTRAQFEELLHGLKPRDTVKIAETFADYNGLAPDDTATFR